VESAKPHKRRPGRPPNPPVATKPLTDIRAFWRLKSRSLGLDSHQAMRTVAFCAVWQRSGHSIDGVIAAGHCGRRTAYNRLRACREAGFEPDLVRFTVQSADDWEAEDRHQIASPRPSTARTSRGAGGCHYCSDCSPASPDAIRTHWTSTRGHYRCWPADWVPSFDWTSAAIPSTSEAHQPSVALVCPSDVGCRRNRMGRRLFAGGTRVCLRLTGRRHRGRAAVRRSPGHRTNACKPPARRDSRGAHS
jgi:hypothetical protein